MEQRLDTTFPQRMDPSARADSACELTMQSPNDDFKQRNVSSPLTSTPFGKDKASLSNGESPVTSPYALSMYFHICFKKLLINFSKNWLPSFLQLYLCIFVIYNCYHFMMLSYYKNSCNINFETLIS